MPESIEPPHSAEPPDQFLVRHLPTIERLVRSFGRRVSLLSADAEDFGSYVKEKLLEDDYRKVRAYRGICPPEHFLAATVSHLGHDFLDKLWRKWRPCAAAEKLGPLAIELDRLLSREGLSFEEACSKLLVRPDIRTTREELERFHRDLPPRIRRRITGEDDLQAMPAPGRTPEEDALAREQEAKQRQVSKLLREVMKGLPATDRTLLRLSFGENLKIADIARQQKTDQKLLYRRREKVLEILRKELTKLGLDKGELSSLFQGHRDA